MLGKIQLEETEPLWPGKITRHGEGWHILTERGATITIGVSDVGPACKKLFFMPSEKNVDEND